MSIASPRNSSSRNSMTSNGSSRLSNPRMSTKPKEKAPRRDILASLHKTTLEVVAKPVLPAEIMASILDYLRPEDLISFARTSRLYREMVYEDTRWIARLRQIGCWDEAMARREAEKVRAAHPSRPDIAPGSGFMLQPPAPAYTSAKGRRTSQSTQETSEGFDAVELNMGPSYRGRKLDIAGALTVLSRVRSIRGEARQEYGKVHAALAPFYNDILSSEFTVEEAPTQSLVFRAYATPEQQAQLLASLRAFCHSDNSPGAAQREERLADIIELFEAAALREFRNGYESGDIEGLMRRYSHVLKVLNGGDCAIELFIEHNHLVTRKQEFGSPSDALDRLTGTVSLRHTQAFLTRLYVAYNEEVEVMQQCFDSSSELSKRFLNKVAHDVISPYIVSLLDETHERNVVSYLTTVSGTFTQTYNFLLGLKTSSQTDEEARTLALATAQSIFEAHMDLYLAEELAQFRQRSEAAVQAWDKQLSEQEASAELMYMSNINRQADKKDFMASFKKVLMAPVNILPAFSNKSTTKADSSQQATGTATPETPTSPAVQTQNPFSSPSRNSMHLTTATPPTRIRSPADTELPTTELAAKAAIMNSKLESIRSLFSIEVALDIVHTGKAALERVAQFVKLSGIYGQLAKQQCEAIFVNLIHYLGHQHVIIGFDKAVEHLQAYRTNQSRQQERAKNPDSAQLENDSGIGSLIKFLELVNVGDLIMQMMDVFYEQELISTKLIDRDDFLAPAVKEKKKFEQKLDERVALGLNKGIDVLMDQVDYVLATRQQTLDFNPEATGSTDPVDVGPSTAAKDVVDIMSSHTKMLVGSIDKSTLDVFNQEIGLRLFNSLCKHLKLQRISVQGSIKLISDMTHYASFIQSMRNKDLSLYFVALRELAQIYLIDPSDAKEMATVIADIDRFHGIFRAEEVYEFASRRADWYQVKAKVDSAIFGVDCCIM